MDGLPAPSPGLGGNRRLTTSPGDLGISAAIGHSIRTVVWDGGGVLVRTEDPSPRHAWEAQLGLARGALEPLVFRNEAAQQAAIGRGGWEEVWAWVAAHLALTEDDRVELERDFFAGDRLDLDLITFIRRLRPAVKTGMLTNAFRSARRDLEHKWKIADAFDVIVVSAEEGVVKPDPRSYRIVLERLGADPGASLFVDDVEENVEGAQRVGMQALRFESTPQVIEEIGRRLGKK